MSRLVDWFPLEYNYCGSQGRCWVRGICDDAGHLHCYCMSSEHHPISSDPDLRGIRRMQIRISRNQAEARSSAAEIGVSFNSILGQPKSDKLQNVTLLRLKEQVNRVTDQLAEATLREEVLFRTYKQLEEKYHATIEEYEPSPA